MTCSDGRWAGMKTNGQVWWMLGGIALLWRHIRPTTLAFKHDEVVVRAWSGKFKLLFFLFYIQSRLFCICFLVTILVTDDERRTTNDRGITNDLHEMTNTHERPLWWHRIDERYHCSNFQGDENWQPTIAPQNGSASYESTKTATLRVSIGFFFLTTILVLIYCLWTATRTMPVATGTPSISIEGLNSIHYFWKTSLSSRFDMLIGAFVGSFLCFRTTPLALEH